MIFFRPPRASCNFSPLGHISPLHLNLTPTVRADRHTTGHGRFALFRSTINVNFSGTPTGAAPRRIAGQHIKNETAEPGNGLAVSHFQIRDLFAALPKPRFFQQPRLFLLPPLHALCGERGPA